MQELTLPEWAFLDANSHEGSPLGLRTIILHVRSMTLIEILNKYGAMLNDDILKVSFKNTTTKEEMIAALHFSTTIDSKEMLIDLLKKCAIWYCDYCDWEDQNIEKESI